MGFSSVQCKRIFHNFFSKNFKMAILRVCANFAVFGFAHPQFPKIYVCLGPKNIIINLNSRLELCPNSHIYFMLKSLLKSPKLSKFLSACAAPFFKISKNLFYKKIRFLPIFWHIKTNLIKNTFFCRPIMPVYNKVQNDVWCS